MSMITRQNLLVEVWGGGGGGGGGGGKVGNPGVLCARVHC